MVTENLIGPRMHKDEEHIEREDMIVLNMQYVQHYNIEDISELTGKQWEEIHACARRMLVSIQNEYGIRDVYNVWEMNNE